MLSHGVFFITVVILLCGDGALLCVHVLVHAYAYLVKAYVFKCAAFFFFFLRVPHFCA